MLKSLKQKIQGLANLGKKKFQGLARPWKIVTYSAASITALFVLIFTVNMAIQYHEYTVAQNQVRKAEALAERSQQKGEFPGTVPRTVKMSVDKSPHYYDEQ